VRTARQTIGKLKEGGVLRAEDEVKYAKMLPELTDTPEVARNKIQLVMREMAQKQNDAIAALEAAGYDVSGVKRNTQVPGAPSALAAGRKGGGLIPSADASTPQRKDPSQMTEAEMMAELGL
jgi:hypothetical protein